MTDLFVRPGAPASSPPAGEPSNLTVATDVAQRILARYGDSTGYAHGDYVEAYGALTETLRIIVRALNGGGGR